MFLSTLIGLNYGELLMEVEFDLHPVQVLANNYSAADAVNSFLRSKDLKWIRYFNILASGQQGAVRMRSAHLMFKDSESWAEFQQENLLRIQALFDHFWVNTRRILWFVADSEGVAFPKNTRQEGIGGGYLYQILYSTLPGKRDDLRAEWKKYIGPFVKDLEENPGFLERTHYVSKGFHGDYDELIQYEFASMPALVQSMHGKAFEELRKQTSKFIDEDVVNILTPGADEALYWHAEGADKADEL